MIKFDGVTGNKDKETEDPEGYGAIEYAYSLMATAAGISMNPCRLMEEGGRRHFMTKRFDRADNGGKLHMQSLGALAHLDFNTAGAHSYEQAFVAIRRLDMGMVEIEEQFRRMLFNVVCRNQYDHVKEHRLLDGPIGRLASVTRIRCHLQLQPRRGVDRTTSDVNQWQARRVCAR